MVEVAAAGSYTFYLNSYRSSQSTSGAMYSVNFKGVYYPAHIGTQPPIPNPPLVSGAGSPQLPPDALGGQSGGEDK